ncbi:MAG: hypothetical protein NQU46_07330 [Methanolinea sp.]|nr:hypothetical protein [Methanolinea sp.]
MPLSSRQKDEVCGMMKCCAGMLCQKNRERLLSLFLPEICGDCQSHG